MNPPAPTPRTLPSLGLLTVGAGATVALLAMPVAAPPLDPAAVLPWWETIGPGAAVMALLRLVGLTAGASLVFVAALGLLSSSTTSTPVRRLWRVVTPRVAQRLMAVGVTAGLAASAALPAGAQDTGPSGPALVDLGPATATDTAPALVDLGAADPAGTETHDIETRDIETRDIETAPDPAPARVESGAEVWTVAPGDHLWAIAEQTLRDRGATTDTSAVARYWRRLIDENRTAIGADEDLVHPGLVLVLPA
ncbi:MAG: hypothetical protein R8F63_05715 [Acidimicrobiales bacterium]|nr:hypothetical protein [Acidimicrobiales bacterium]